MGLDINGTKFLLYARSLGVSFSETAMVGRQTMLVNRDDLRSNLHKFGIDLSETDADGILTGTEGYAETFLDVLGAERTVSFDASEYEKATVIHDFNQPIPDEFKNRFTAVLDGGTLEHVFNFPTAIKNCMEMIKEGGHFLGISPTNNQLGHGFYQFSPEVYFRIFSEENGFETRKVIIFEETRGSSWYQVADPNKLAERVTLKNQQPTMLLVIAKKIKTADIFSSPPQQSDYVALWDGSSPVQSGGKEIGQGVFSLAKRVPAAVLRRIKLNLDRTFGSLNRTPKHFKKIDIE